MTKDAIAGRIRRLLTMADKRARDTGHAGHRVGGHPDMLDMSGPLTRVPAVTRTARRDSVAAADHGHSGGDTDMVDA